MYQYEDNEILWLLPLEKKEVFLKANDIVISKNERFNLN
jgi:hypothetical protein